MERDADGQHEPEPSREDQAQSLDEHRRRTYVSLNIIGLQHLTGSNVSTFCDCFGCDHVELHESSLSVVHRVCPMCVWGAESGHEYDGQGVRVVDCTVTDGVLGDILYAVVRSETLALCGRFLP